MYRTLMKHVGLKRGGIALVVLATALVGVGLGTRNAQAQVPVLSAGGPYQTTVGQAIQFTGTSYVGSLSTATWTFSDGVSLSGISVSRSFAAAGTYTATLTVTDLYGRSYVATTSVTVTVPATTIIYPVPLLRPSIIRPVNPQPISSPSPPRGGPVRGPLQGGGGPTLPQHPRA